VNQLRGVIAAVSAGSRTFSAVSSSHLPCTGIQVRQSLSLNATRMKRGCAVLMPVAVPTVVGLNAHES